MILEEMIATHNFKDKSTNHLLVDAVINCAKCESHLRLLSEWLESGNLTTLTG